MIFAFSITIPPRTYIEDEIYEELPLTKGKLSQVNVFFPPGCAGLVGVRFFRYAFQVLPANFPSWVISDAEDVELPCEVDISAEPYSITLGAYNEDDTYPHTLYIRCRVDVPESVRRREEKEEEREEELMEWLWSLEV